MATSLPAANETVNHRQIWVEPYKSKPVIRGAGVPPAIFRNFKQRKNAGEAPAPLSPWKWYCLLAINGDDIVSKN
jgi:hypothetical protein